MGGGSGGCPGRAFCLGGLGLGAVWGGFGGLGACHGVENLGGAILGLFDAAGRRFWDR
jgi:hypothetical protein